MGEKSISEKLVSVMQEISQYEISEIQLITAIIKKNISDLIESNMKNIENEIIYSCEYYGRNSNDFQNEKKEILEGYRSEFENIATKFEEQYMNIALETQESQSNQKIAITNMKKVIDSKKKYMESSEYKSFLDKLSELESKRDNASSKEEYDSIVNYLDQVQDPISVYNAKIDAFAEKYVSYCAIETSCLENLKKINEKVEGAINSVMQFDVGKLAVSGKKSIFSIFSRLLNKISGAKKFEKEYILKKKSNLEKIKDSTAKVMEEISNETVGIIYSLGEVKQEINQAFSEAV